MPSSLETNGISSEMNSSDISSRINCSRVGLPPVSKSGTVTSSALAKRSRELSVGVAFVTVSGSHSPVEPTKFASPLYVAWKPYEPAASGPSGLDGSAMPLPSTAAVPAAVELSPVHVAFVKNLNETVPVGLAVLFVDVTVALSWTTVPSGTVVTTLFPASLIAVTVVVGAWATENGSQAPVWPR